VETVLQLINHDQDWRQALIRLWHLGRQSDPDGGTRFHLWSRAEDNHLASERITKFFAGHAKHPSLRLDDLQHRTGDVIQALDLRLNEGEKRSPSQPPFPVRIDGCAYHLVPCRSHNGYEQTQPPRFSNFMRHHRIIPTGIALASGSEVKVRLIDSASFGSLHQQLKEQAEQNSGIHCAVGLFADGGEPQGSTVATSKTHGKCFFTHTTTDSTRLVSALSQIDTANAAEATVLIFPELTLSLANQASLLEALRQRWQTNERLRIPLLLLGSFHQDVPPKRNQARLICGPNLSEIAIHNKFSQATLGPVTEDFQPGNEVVLFSTPLGNISLAICKDSFDEFHPLWLDHLAPSLLLVPSLSDKVTAHLKKTQELWNRHRCITVVANQPWSSCQQSAPPDEADPYFGFIHAEQVYVRDDNPHWQQTIRQAPQPEN
jgi:hypothetical protein